MKKILIIDDTAEFLNLLADVLKKDTDFKIYTAGGVKEALTLLDKINVDLICSDLYMGDGVGTDILYYLNQKQSRIPFILMSNSEFNNEISIAISNGAKFISKCDMQFVSQIISIAKNGKC